MSGLPAGRWLAVLVLAAVVIGIVVGYWVFTAF